MYADNFNFSRAKIVLLPKIRWKYF